jgi:hypothetical protein
MTVGRQLRVTGYRLQGTACNGGERAEAERLKPPQQLRKASQTARGFNGVTATSHPGADAQVPGEAACRLAAESAKADFVLFKRRIHSLTRADGT